ncbi:hypothetical protein ACH5RR_020826 [Cinchona calisaya]|uniref:Uncharacterized protein n=1 Tax=Cinchona calisaya TaxID=153742 RepID=A0ABD2ZJD3_9GENT
MRLLIGIRGGTGDEASGSQKSIVDYGGAKRTPMYIPPQEESIHARKRRRLISPNANLLQCDGWVVGMPRKGWEWEIRESFHSFYLFLSIIEGVKAVAFLAGCAALTWAAFSAKNSSNSFNQACQKWGKKDGPALFEVTIFKGMKLPKFTLFPKIRLSTFGGKGKGRLEGSQAEA